MREIEREEFGGGREDFRYRERPKMGPCGANTDETYCRLVVHRQRRKKSGGLDHLTTSGPSVVEVTCFSTVLYPPQRKGTGSRDQRSYQISSIARTAIVTLGRKLFDGGGIFSLLERLVSV